MTTWQFTPYLVPIIVATLFTGILAIYTWTHRTTRGATALFIIILAAFVWVAAYALEIASTSLTAKLFWVKIEYLGIAPLPVAWLIFALLYTNRSRLLTVRNVVSLSLVPIISIIMVWSSAYHPFFYANISLSSMGGIINFYPTYGPYFWLHVTYSYLCYLVGTVLLFRQYFEVSSVYRRQTTILMLGSLLPFVVSVLFLLAPTTLDPAPIAFSISAILFAWGFFRFRLLELLPDISQPIRAGAKTSLAEVVAEGRRRSLSLAIFLSTGLLTFLTVLLTIFELRQPTISWVNLTAYMLAYSSMLLLTILPDIPYRLRAALFISLQFLFATFSLVTFGMELGVGFFLVILIFYTLNFFGRRAGVIALIVGFFTIWFGAWLVYVGIIRSAETGVIPTEILSLIITPYFFLYTIGIAVIVLMQQQRDTLTIFQRAQQLSLELEQERELLELRVAERTGALQRINRVVTAVAVSLDLRQNMQVIVDELAGALDIEQAGIALLNEARTALTVIADHYNPEHSPSALGTVISLDDNAATQQVINTRQTMIIQDAQHSPMIKTAHEILRQRGTKTLVILPMIIGDEVVGTLGIDLLEEHESLSSDQLNLAETLVRQAATAVQKTRLIERTQTALVRQEYLSAQLRAVSEVGTAVSNILDLEKLLQSVVELTKERFAFYEAFIFLLDETKSKLLISAGTGKAGEVSLQQNAQIRLDEISIIGRAARERGPIVVNDASIYTNFRPNPLLPETRSELAVPMIANEQLLGVLDVQSNQIDRFADEDILVQQALASQIAVAVQNAYLYAEQVETAEKLREVDRLKSEFLANISHELRTPLNAIIGFADILLTGIEGQLNERIEEDVTIIRSNSQHLYALIDDLLDMSKIEFGGVELDYQQVDIRQLVTEVADSVRVLSDEKHLEIHVHVATAVGQLCADKMRLRQVLLNIISNAIKFTRIGHITISIHSDAENMLFKVVDTGIGIAPENNELVFEQFRQVENQGGDGINGTGLGMSISKHLVELHGGEIGLESMVGEGSTFWFTIPFKAENCL